MAGVMRADPITLLVGFCVLAPSLLLIFGMMKCSSSLFCPQVATRSMYTVFQNEKWCKNTELQQNKQSENCYQSTAHAMAVLLVHPQLLSACLLGTSSSTKLLWLSPFGNISFGGHVLERAKSYLGEHENAIPSLGEAAWPRESQQLCCIFHREQQWEHEGEWGLCHWLKDFYELCLLIPFFFFSFLQY